jgi:hypothetical protein
MRVLTPKGAPPFFMRASDPQPSLITPTGKGQSRCRVKKVINAAGHGLLMGDGQAPDSAARDRVAAAAPGIMFRSPHRAKIRDSAGPFLGEAPVRHAPRNPAAVQAVHCQGASPVGHP